MNIIQKELFEELLQIEKDNNPHCFENLCSWKWAQDDSNDLDADFCLEFQEWPKKGIYTQWEFLSRTIESVYEEADAPFDAFISGRFYLYSDTHGVLTAIYLIA
jgi:hypothetical protein